MNRFYLKTIFIMNLILCNFVNSSDSADYYCLQKTFDKACIAYYVRNYETAFLLFEDIIKIDEYNFYWESYYYLSQIYLKRYDKGSAICILKEGLNKATALSNAHSFYKIAIHAIKNDKVFDIDDKHTWLEFHDLIPYDYTHPYPSKGPEPAIDREELTSDIADILSLFTDTKVSEIYFKVGVDKNGRVWRVLILKPQFNAEIQERLFKYLFKTKWHPAVDGKLKFNIAVSFSIDVSDYLKR